MKAAIFILLLLSSAWAQTLPNTAQIDEMKKLIKNKNVTSLEAFLDYVPDTWKENVNLVHDSKSIQGASKENPRAILSSNDGRTNIAFNGHHAQPGFDAIEVLQFNDKTKRFELFEIEFKQGQAPKISEPNPSRCTKCHGEDPRPLWDEYPLWPGTYGMSDGKIGGFPELRNGSPLEPGEWKKFMATAVNHPRYKKLNLKEIDTYLTTGFVKNTPKTEAGGMPKRMLLKFYYLNSQRVLARLRELPRFKEIEDLFLMNMMCETPASNGMHRLQVLYNNQGLGEASRFAAALEMSYLQKGIPFPGLSPKQLQSWHLSISGSPYGHNDGELSTIKDWISYAMMLERPSEFEAAFDVNKFIPVEKYDLDMYDLPPNTNLKAYNAKKLQEHKAEVKKETKKFLAGEVAFTRHRIPSPKNMCDALIEKNRPSIKQEDCDSLTAKLMVGEVHSFAESLSAITEAVDASAVFANKCFHCHTGDLQGATPIPFNDLVKLKQYLKDNPQMGPKIIELVQLPEVSAKRMPKDDNLTDSELKYILEFVGGQ